jgi:2-phosphosulfolactate phosphatase
MGFAKKVSSMRIRRLSLLQGSHEARGTTVIIDVFRAFTCEPLLFYYGASQIILEADIEKCRSLQGDYLRIGESNEIPIEGFDLTNSPSLILAKGRDYFAGKRIIHRSTSGVGGAVNAFAHADEVLLASFINAAATARYIKSRSPDLVSIVAMGILSQENAPEDDHCGDYIESLLNGRPYDHVRAIREILVHETAQKFLRGDKFYLPKEDPAICLQRDLIDVALAARKQGDLLVSTRLPPG